jgi:hypothetical protein
MPAKWSCQPSRLAGFFSLALLASLVSTALAGDFELASMQLFKKKNDCDCQPCPQIIPAPAPAPAPTPDKKEPEKKPEEKAPAIAPPVVPPLVETPEFGPALGAGGYSLASSNVGYLDPAIPASCIRFRFDAAYDNVHPDRAEYFYAKYQSIGGKGVPNPESRVDYQDVTLQLEYAINKRFSVFAEVPYMWINPEVNSDARAFGDMNAGFKYAAVANDDLFVTFQFRTYIPTGATDLGIGNGLVSIEPAMLFWKKINERTILEGGLYDWQPLNGSDYAGNVVEYGLGLSYYVIDKCKWKVAPVLEVVGWTCLSGKQTAVTVGQITPGAPAIGIIGIGTPGTSGVAGVPGISAAGDTIINIKPGIRVEYNDRWSFYVGYGHCITGDQWYRNLVRAELRWNF